MQQVFPRAAVGGQLIPIGTAGLDETITSNASLAQQGGVVALNTVASLLTKSGQVKGYTTTQGAIQVGAAAGQGFLAGGPIGAGVAAAISALQLLFSRKGPKQKTATTAIVNQVEPILKQNLAGYLAGPRTVSSQTVALGVFDAGFAYVVEYCDIPQMGAPGKACVSERSPGGKWDWYAYYRDPIANDPNVVPDPTGTEEIGSSLSSLFGTNTTGEGIDPKILIAAALIGGALLLGGKS